MPYANVRGVRLWYDTAGVGDTPVVLLMGLGGRGCAWQPQIEGLKEHHRLLWLDFRGVGSTEMPPVRFSMSDLARDVVGLMDHCDWPSAHVVGLSMGGMVAQELALRYRHRVRSLSLIATTAGGLVGKLITPTAFKLFWKALFGSPRTRARAGVRLLFPPAFLETIDRSWLRRVLRPEFAEGSTALGRAAQLVAVMGHDTVGRLPSLEGLPALVVRSGQDVLVPGRESDRLARRIPGAHTLRLDDAGHGVTWQHTEAVNQALLAHFARADESLAGRRGHLGAA